MKVLEIKNVHKIYNSSEVKVHAVNGVDLTFEEGEFAAIVGPSGSGKTTLLNMIGGLDTPSEGIILVDQTDLSDLKSSRLIDFRLNNIGFVFQSYNLIPVLTARENVEFIMNLQKWPKKEREARTKEMLEAVGLGDRLNSKPSKLSGGQQQRVAVARALASKPKFVLADEPTANLDSKTGQGLLEMMQQMNAEKQITFIFSTHDRMVMEYARRLVKLRDGRLVDDEIKSNSVHS